MIKTRLVRLLSHAKKYIVYSILWQWAALLAQVLAVFSIAGLLGTLADNREDLVRTLGSLAVGRTALILVSAAAIRFLCERMAARASYGASADVKRILRKKIYEKLLKLGVSYKEKTSTSEVVQLSTEGVEQLEVYFGKYLPQLFYSLLAPLTLFGILSFVNLRASLVLLICVPLIPASIAAVQKLAKKLLSRYWGIYTELGDSFLENLQGLTTLKIYQADEQKAEEMDREAQEFRRITMKILTMQLNSTSVMDIVAYGGAAVGMMMSVSEFLAGRLDFSGTLTIILLASEFFIPLRLLGSFFHIAMNGMTASDKIFRLLDLEEPKVGEEPMPRENFDMELWKVGFSYEKDREILKDVCLAIPQGSFVSLVGGSGCGKSTIAGLLTGKLENYQGEILIGGKLLSRISERELMEHVTLVRHNSYIFKGTVEENLRMAKPQASEEEMKRVLSRVNLLGFLDTQEGIKTRLLEQGANLSGGQRQRLALARALLHDTPVYIFDEATSNIDAESEDLIMEVIRELARTRTVLLISHRLSNVVASDRIYLLDHGKILEQGTHQELMEQKGAYRKLYEAQKNLEMYGKEAGA
ncbi:MAG TPA: ABC transporter ATP-binding protein/permease [Candidatus Blautia avicola]|uniref:ABC transporter ATP-binding protein/permease n=1 Tax=Candidatus Blautia avicola TaxID=2838483 RepID=A0A9D2QUW2_9FIRM|nr:ABC transporter ATP-binding protein/permease [Candidatus Blautia avicola]